jgi:cell pole-organizing protein PopZ
MEEILASIRRIIADDEAKPPPAADKPAPAPKAEKPAAPPPPAKPPVAEAPPKPSAPPAAAKAPAPPPAAPAPPPAAPVSNSQDDIDALLNGLDAATTPEEIRPAQAEAEVEVEPEADADVLDLTDDMVAVPEVAPPAPPPSFRKVEPHDDLEFTESAAVRAIRQPSYDPPRFESAPAAPAAPILSQTTVSAVESAFNTLAHTVLSNNARTLEDLVKEMLRPMLKSWLDDNLPGLVERIVKAEIERVSRGR